jgi:hypothetical protein
MIKLMKILLENAVKEMIKGGEIIPSKPQTKEKAAKKLKAGFNSMSEAEIIRAINYGPH